MYFKFQIQPSQYSADQANSGGFTIIELLVSIAIFSVLIAITVTVLANVFFNSSQQFFALSNIDNAELVSNRFVNELRNATTGADGSYALSVADNNQIIFYSKGATSGATVDRIDYYFSGNTLYEGIVVPTGSPLSYNLASESKTIVQNDVANSPSNPVFTYYDGNYSGSGSPFSQPVNVNLVTFVKINLTIQNQVQQGSSTSFSISTGAAMRNVKTNLGD